MIRSVPTGLRVVLGLALVTAAGLLAHRSNTAAQQPSTPYNLLASRERVVSLVRAWNDRTGYVPGEVLVKFRPGSQPADQGRALTVLRGGIATGESRWIGEVLVAKTPGEPDAAVAASILSRQPEVEWAQPNYLRPLRATPNDPAFPRQWNFNLIDLPRAWDINPGATAQVRVAVIDSGITTVTQTYVFSLWTGSRFENVPIPFRVNPDIPGTRILPGRDFVFWDGPVLDLDGHGTHVAGTILEETNNSLSLAGIAYKATLMPLKACLGYWDIQLIVSAQGEPGYVDPAESGFCEDAAIVQALRYAADNGAQIANLSLGGTDQSPLLLDALRYAVGKGVFVATAVGNEFLEGNPVEYPAAYGTQIEGVVAVGAVGPSRRRAFYSNTGPYVEIVAPGGDHTDGGSSALIYQSSLLSASFNPATVIRPRFDQYADEPNEGTSMATPHVAGLAALLYAQGITRPAAIEAAIKQFAQDLGPIGPDNEYGYGLIQARAAVRGMGLAK